MIQLETFIKNFSDRFNQGDNEPWELIQQVHHIVLELMSTLGKEYIIQDEIAIHRSAVIEKGVTLKGPMIVGENCFIGANAYLRNGVYLGKEVKIGTGCEIKSSIIFDQSSIAHFNFIGDSIIGRSVNFEAGSITANHFNERMDKDIHVLHQGSIINTNVHKFGALVGDNSKIGANAVLSPGTLLAESSIVKRLELIEQVIQN